MYNMKMCPILYGSCTLANYFQNLEKVQDTY